MFIPSAIYYESDILNYSLGKQLMNQYENVPKTIIIFMKCVVNKILNLQK